MNKGYKGIGLRMRNSGRNEKMCFVGQVGWVDGQILGGKKEGMKQEHGDVLHMKDMKIWEGKRELSARIQDPVISSMSCQMDEMMEKRQMQEKKIGLRDG